jgi:hypothetical protein
VLKTNCGFWSSWDMVLEQGTVIAERLAAKTVDALDELFHQC